MTNSHGSMIWYELMTSDADAARRFYGDVVGWTFSAHPGSTAAGGTYHIISAPDGAIGGMMEISEDMRTHGGKPLWVGYFGVDDVDQTAKAICAAGGRLFMGPMDLPDVGRVAMAADPFGAAFYIIRPTPPPGNEDASSAAFHESAVGHCAWNELVTSDLRGALDFYQAQFDVTRGDTMPMGEMGDYQFIEHDGRTIGGAMKAFAAQPLGWTYYFRVPDIDAAHERLLAGGGQVTMGAHQVPGGDWVVIGIDPQGARFGIVGKRKG